MIISADVTCPLTTGIFLRYRGRKLPKKIGANGPQAHQHRTGACEKKMSGLNPKFPGGEPKQARQLRSRSLKSITTR